MTNSDALGPRLLSAVARINRWATRNAHFDTPSAQARLLSLIEELGSARIGELAAADNCSQPTMTAQVQRVVAAGWARRGYDPHDARVSLVELTAEGRRTIDGVRAARAEAVAPLFANLSSSERKSLEQATMILEEFLARAGPLAPSYAE